MLLPLGRHGVEYAIHHHEWNVH